MSIASVSGSPSLITPFSASKRPVIRGERVGDTGNSESRSKPIGLDEGPSPFSVGTEEGT